MKQGDEAKVGFDNTSCTQRKTYSSPQLTLFGQVAALTQNVSCSASDDGNQACIVGQASSSMGKMP